MLEESRNYLRFGGKMIRILNRYVNDEVSVSRKRYKNKIYLYVYENNELKHIIHIVINE